jgi:hypothetical protein
MSARSSNPGAGFYADPGMEYDIRHFVGQANTKSAVQKVLTRLNAAALEDSEPLWRVAWLNATPAGTFAVLARRGCTMSGKISKMTLSVTVEVTRSPYGGTSKDYYVTCEGSGFKGEGGSMSLGMAFADAYNEMFEKLGNEVMR